MDTRTWLGIVGVVLVGVGFASWYLQRDSGSSTVTERYTRAETVKETSAPAETSEEVQSFAGASPGTTTSSSKRTTTGGTSAETVRRPATKIVKTEAKPERSDALILGFVGFGCAFILAGAFYNRITALKFPGGEVTLASSELEKSVGEMKLSLESTKNAVKRLTRQVQELRQERA